MATEGGKPEAQTSAAAVNTVTASCRKKKFESATFLEDVRDHMDEFIHASMDEHKNCFRKTMQKMFGMSKVVAERHGEEKEVESELPLRTVISEYANGSPVNDGEVRLRPAGKLAAVGIEKLRQLAAVRSGAGSRVLDLTLKVAAGVVLDVVGGVDDPAARVVEPVGAGRVEAAVVARGLEMRINGVKKIRPRIEAVRVRPVRKRRIPAEITKVKKPKI
nr:Dipeptide transport ATP-binding protein dppF [Ipomoea batatas]